MIRKIFCADERKDGEEKVGKYLEKKRKFLLRRRTEKEKQENISCGGVKKLRRKRRKVFAKGK